MPKFNSWSKIMAALRAEDLLPAYTQSDLKWRDFIFPHFHHHSPSIAPAPAPANIADLWLVMDIGKPITDCSWAGAGRGHAGADVS